MSGAERQDKIADKWLLLIHQLPAKPAYQRVKVWRRLQALGAVPIKNSVYVLPFSPDTQEDFEWMLTEIAEGGGDAIVCEARMLLGLNDRELRAQFNAARDADYEELTKGARKLLKTLAKQELPLPQAEERAQLGRLKARLGQVTAVDYCGADGREAAEGLIREIDAIMGKQGNAEPPASTERVGIKGLMGRVWVTRQGVHIDRIATAWLIRKFIDPKAKFKFVPARGYHPAAGEVRFDMADAEFTHIGDRCTFEVLLEKAELRERALQAIGEIVHDIDLKDAKFARPQTEGIRTLIAGICMTIDDDAERIKRGSAVFDDLYQYFSKVKG